MVYYRVNNCTRAKISEADRCICANRAIQAFNTTAFAASVNRNTGQSLSDNLTIAVAMFRPSVLALFTHRGRSFFEKLLVPRNAREYALNAKCPCSALEEKLQIKGDKTED